MAARAAAARAAAARAAAAVRGREGIRRVVRILTLRAAAAGRGEGRVVVVKAARGEGETGCCNAALKWLLWILAVALKTLLRGAAAAAKMEGGTHLGEAATVAGMEGRTWLNKAATAAVWGESAKLRT
jgi:hypothetical protein